MAHFALLNEQNIVTNVIVVSDEHEANGAEWCNKMFGGRWIQTSYNHKIRKNYAGIGYIYDETQDAFIPPKNPSLSSWIFNETKYNWEPPIPYPQDGKEYFWNEEIINWQEYKRQ